MAEPVSLELAKQHLRIEPDFVDEDNLISGIISDARAWVESYTGQTLIEGEVTEYIDCFDARLLTWPIQEITGLVYSDSAGVEQTISSDGYYPAINRRPARLCAVSGTRFPATARAPDAVKVTMTAGYADGTVPRGMIRAMLLLISGYYTDRETGGLADEVEGAAKRACGAGSRGWRL